MSPLPKVWLIAGAALAVVVLGVGGYFVFRSEPTPNQQHGKGAAPDTKTPDTKTPDALPEKVPPVTSAELKLVPSDALGFVSLRVADWWQGKSGEVLRGNPEVKELVEQMRHSLGMGPEDIARALFIWPTPFGKDGGPDPGDIYLLVTTRKPAESYRPGGRPLIRNPKDTGKEKGYMVIPGQKEDHVLNRVDGDTYAHVADNNLLVFGKMAGILTFLNARSMLGAAPGAPTPWHDVLGLAEVNHLVAAGALTEALWQMLPEPVAKELQPLASLKKIALIGHESDGLQLELRLTFPDGAKATAAEAWAAKWRKLGEETLAKAAKSEKDGATARVLELLKSVSLAADGPLLRAQLKTPSFAGEWGPGVIAALTRSASRYDEPHRQMAMNYMQVALAFHGFVDMHKQMATNFTKFVTNHEDAPGLSWRVAILPFIGEQKLYAKFKLDEPWDSPANIKLLAEIPPAYRPSNPKAAPQGHTFVQLFTGRDTLYPEDNRRPPHMPRSFRDGTTNTIMVAEAASAVPWTKPADLAYGPTLPKLGNFDGKGFFAGMADGVPRFFPHSLNEKWLRALICPHDGILLPFEIMEDSLVLARPRRIPSKKDTDEKFIKKDKDSDYKKPPFEKKDFEKKDFEKKDFEKKEGSLRPRQSHQHVVADVRADGRIRGGDRGVRRRRPACGRRTMVVERLVLRLSTGCKVNPSVSFS